MKKKLYRSRGDKIIAGVFGGLAEYIESDSNFLRIVGLLIFIFSGFIPFLVAYLLASLIIPTKKEKTEKH